MFVAGLADRALVLRHLVNQEGVTLLMATLGITYFLDGLGQTIFGSDIYKIDVGMPKEPVFLFEGVFQGGVLVNLEDVYAASSPLAGGGAVAVLPEDRHRTRAARGGRRPPGGAVDRHPAQPDLGHRLVRRRHHRAGGRHHLGLQAGRAVLADHGGAACLPVIILGGLTSVPGAIIGGLIIGVGEKLSEVYLGPFRRRRHRDLVRLCAGAGLPAVPAAGPVRRKDH
jgi:branched-chain amino acid transport system permease protein